MALTSSTFKQFFHSHLPRHFGLSPETGSGWETEDSMINRQAQIITHRIHCRLGLFVACRAGTPCVILHLVLLSFFIWSIAVQWSRDLPVWSLLQGSSVSLGLELRDARPVHGHAFFYGDLSNPQPLSLHGKDEGGSDSSEFWWSS
jgi:hypothetical protein